MSDPGHLMNGTFALPVAAGGLVLQGGLDRAGLERPVTITFKQHIDAGDALRTGAYSKTLTFTLSTTTP